MTPRVARRSHHNNYPSGAPSHADDGARADGARPRAQVVRSSGATAEEEERIEAELQEQADALIEKEVKRAYELYGDKATDPYAEMHPHTDLIRKARDAWKLQHDGTAEGRVAAETMYRQLIAAYRARVGDQSRWTVRQADNLAALLEEEGRHAEAEPLWRASLAAKRATVGGEGELPLGDGRYAAAGGPPPSRGEVCTAAFRLASSLHTMATRELPGVAAPSYLGEAEALMREAKDGFAEERGPRHENTLSALGHLAQVIQDAGRLEEAEATHREAFESFVMTFGPSHVSSLGCATSHTIASSHLPC